MIDTSQLPTDTKDLTPEQRLYVVLNTEHGQSQLFVNGLLYALDLVAEDGWKYVATAWLEAARKDA